MNFAKRITAAVAEEKVKKLQALLSRAGIQTSLRQSPLLKRSLKSIGWELSTESSEKEAEAALRSIGGEYVRGKGHFALRGFGKIGFAQRGGLTLMIVD